MKGRWIWGLALACFALAASTGAYFRFALITPLPGVPDNIRHAHSHLMFFSWVTPALILLIGADLARRGARPRGFAATALLAAIGGLTTYLPFLKSGYHLTPFAGKLLPISMLASGLNGFVWYAFAICYVVATWGLRRDARLRLFDVAVVLMLISTISVGGLAYLGMGGQIQRHVMLALVDWFLTLFADGWFGLAILGLAALHSHRERVARHPVGALGWLLATGMVVRSVGRYLGDAQGLSWAPALEGAGGAVAALVWLGLVFVLWRVDPRPETHRDGSVVTPPTGVTLLLRQLVLALLVVKGVVELAAATPGLTAYITQTAFRIFFLHAFLLGAVSFAVIYGMRTQLGAAAYRGAGAFIIAVGIMVAALAPLTPAWPRALAGPWLLPVAAYTSLLPLVVALFSLFTLDLGSARRAPPPTPLAAPPEPPAP